MEWTIDVNLDSQTVIVVVLLSMDFWNCRVSRARFISGIVTAADMRFVPERLGKGLGRIEILEPGGLRAVYLAAAS